MVKRLVETTNVTLTRCCWCCVAPEQARVIPLRTALASRTLRASNWNVLRYPTICRRRRHRGPGLSTGNSVASVVMRCPHPIRTPRRGRLARRCYGRPLQAVHGKALPSARSRNQQQRSPSPSISHLDEKIFPSSSMAVVGSSCCTACSHDPKIEE